MKRKKTELRKKLKLSSHNNSTCKTVGLILLCSAATFSGCARLPLGNIIAEDNRATFKHRYASYLQTLDKCSKSYDGDMIISWKHTLENLAFSGYFQTMLPSSLKFTALNPLGQPLFAVASNGKWFQVIDTGKKMFMSGSLRSYSIRSDIPYAFLAGEWGIWLTGRPLTSAPYILEIHDDKENRGTWFGLGEKEKDRQPREHILLNLDKNKIVERLVLDRTGRMEATITYENWQNISECRQPMKISVTGLSFGAEAQFTLSDVRLTELTPKDFELPVPQAYNRRLLP